MRSKIIVATLLIFSLTQPFSVVAEEPPNPLPETPWRTFRLPVEAKREFKIEKLPDKIRDLDGKRLRIRGYIWPPSVFANEVEDFYLTGEVKNRTVVIRSGEKVPLDACMHVRLKRGTARVHFGPIAVTGTFHVRPIKNKAGDIMLVYFFDADSVERVEKRPSHGPAIMFDL